MSNFLKKNIYHTLVSFLFGILISIVILTYFIEIKYKNIHNPYIHNLLDNLYNFDFTIITIFLSTIFLSFLIQFYRYISSIKFKEESDEQNDTKEYNALINALHKMNEQIEDNSKPHEKSQNITNYLINISHELRTPMHAIVNIAEMGYSEIDSLSKDKIISYFQKIEKSCDRLIFILNDILDLSKLEASKINFKLEKNDILKCINSAINEITSLSNNKHINISINCKSKKTIAIFDNQRIAQVIINLLGNAIKFSRENSAIKVIIENINNELLISIEDEGPGISVKELDTIFDKFSQSELNNNAKIGTGIGLTICKEIIKHHNGKIWAENRTDKRGAIFKFKLPVT